MNLFERYQLLKKQLSGLSYNGYPLDRVCGSYLGMLIWKSSFILWIRYLFFNPKGIPVVDSQRIILTYSTKRKDYKQLMEAYFPRIEQQYVRIINTKWQVLSSIGVTIKSVFSSMMLLGRPKNNLTDYFMRLIVVSVAIKIIDEIESRDEIKTQKYVAFNSSYLFESFLSFYFRKRGIDTYSLQHGMYFKYQPTCTPFDVINYENVCAKSLLVWGEYTKRQIEDEVPKDVSLNVVGNPLLTLKYWPKNGSDKIYVMLPRDTYWNESLQLLNILKKMKHYEFVVRPHPSVKDKASKFCSNTDRFDLDFNSNPNELLSSYQYKAVISFNSTSVFTALSYGQNLLYYENSSEMACDMFTTFSNKNELKIRLVNLVAKLDASYFYSQFGKSFHELFLN